MRQIKKRPSVIFHAIWTGSAIKKSKKEMSNVLPKVCTYYPSTEDALF